MRERLILQVCLLLIGVSLCGQSNTSYDVNAGNAGLRNTSFGYHAGYSITGNENLFVGYIAGKYSTSEDFNTFWGYLSGYANTTGKWNAYIGVSSGRYGSLSNHNVALGNSAGYSSTTSRNVSLGKSSLYSNASGERNVSIGYASGYNSSGSYNVFLGYRAGYNETGSNKLYIENDSSSAPLIYGEFDNDFVTINGKLGVGASNVPDSISLLVDSLIIAKEVVISTRSFPDYVFEENYKLATLGELEDSINILGHLPGIPSKEEVLEQGIDTGTLSLSLLEKVEELTLYLIELDEELSKEEGYQKDLISLFLDLQSRNSETK